MNESSNTAPETARPFLIPPHAWIQILVIGVLFIMLHSHVLGTLWRAGKTPNWSHIYLIPFLSLYLVYRQRDRLRRCPVQKDPRGLLVFVIGLGAYSAGIQVHSTMIMGYAMIIELLGLVWFMVGISIMKTLWLPIVYLAFAIKFTFIYTYISLVLQHVAAGGGSFVVNLLGLPWDIEADNLGALLAVYHRGVLIEPPLNVEEACSGLRSLMALCAIAVAMAFMDRRRWYSRLCIVVSAVPVAVAVNVFRISLTGMIYPYNPELCRGGPHDFLGMIMLVPAMFLLGFIMRLCDQLWPARRW